MGTTPCGSRPLWEASPLGDLKPRGNANPSPKALASAIHTGRPLWEPPPVGGEPSRRPAAVTMRQDIGPRFPAKPSGPCGKFGNYGAQPGAPEQGGQVQE